MRTRNVALAALLGVLTVAVLVARSILTPLRTALEACERAAGMGRIKQALDSSSAPARGRAGVISSSL